MFREIIGVIAIGASMLIYQQKTRKKLLLSKGIADTLWIIHYLLLGGYTGAAITGIALVRGVVFYKTEKRSKGILLGFLTASVICTAITWGDVFSLFPAAASLMAVFSFWLGIPKVSRLMCFPISSCMLIYGLHNGSLSVMINECLAMVSALLGLIRMDGTGKDKQNEVSHSGIQTAMVCRKRRGSP